MKVDKNIFTGKNHTMLPDKIEVLENFIEAAKVNPELTFGDYVKLNGIDHKGLINNAPSALSELPKSATTIDVATTVNTLNKHLYNNRAKTLAEKLKLINTFLFTTKGKKFGQYLDEQKIPRTDFFAGLPKQYQDEKAFDMNKLDLMQYAHDINVTYFNQFAKFAKTAPEGISGKKIMGEWNKGDAYSASGNKYLTAKVTGTKNTSTPAVGVGTSKTNNRVASRNIGTPTNTGGTTSGGGEASKYVNNNIKPTGVVLPSSTFGGIVGVGKPTVGGIPIPQGIPVPVSYPPYPPADTSGGGASGGGGGDDSGGGGDSSGAGDDSYSDQSQSQGGFPLNYGDSNDYVSALQQALGINVTGTFDDATLGSLQGQGYNSPLSEDAYSNIVNGGSQAQTPSSSDNQTPAQNMFPLNYGDSNNNVYNLQNALVVPATGTFDDATLAALQGSGYGSPLSQDDYNTIMSGQTTNQQAGDDLQQQIDSGLGGDSSFDGKIYGYKNFSASGFWGNVLSDVKKDTGDVTKGVDDIVKGAEDDVKDIGKDLKKVNLQDTLYTLNRYNPAMIPLRAMVSGIVEVNMFGMATDFDREKGKNSPAWTKILELWKLIGGDDANLSSSVSKGRGKKKFMGADGYSADSQASKSATEGTSVAATVEAGCSIIAPAVGTAGCAPYAAAAGGVVTTMVDVLPADAGSKQSVPPSGAGSTPPSGMSQQTWDAMQQNIADSKVAASKTVAASGSFFSKYKKQILIGTAVVLIGVVLLGAIPKKAAA